MRPILMIAVALLLAQPALAEDMPKSPKAAPPEPLPEATCDVSRANNGEWLQGRWVAPESTHMEFSREGDGLVWVFDRKGSVNRNMGWNDATRFGGKVDKVTACTVKLSGGEGAFVLEGVLTEDGKLYSYAVNPKGETARFVFRRMR